MALNAQHAGQNALAHITQVQCAGCHQRVGHSLQFLHARLQGMVPGPGRTVATQNAGQGITQQIGIGDEFTVGGEDGGLRGTQTGTGLALQHLQLLADGQHGRLQGLAIGDDITRDVMHIKLVTDVPDQRANGQTGARANTVNGLRTAAWQPVGGVAARGEGIAAGAFGIGLFFG
ncbi:MAG: hypothetical protein ACD_23C00801G0001 [uncultured bacterium]|nr:MAG: hypothetical protein ACD_23C00801G0001 [uncultured bacterium]